MRALRPRSCPLLMLSVHRSVGPKRIVRIAGVYEAGVAAVAQQFLRLLDRLTNHAGRLASLELTLNLDKRSVGGLESSRKDRGDVESDA